LIYAGVGRGCLEPASANIFQSRLGLTRATAFDVLDACASWLRSVAIAQSFIHQGIYNTVMILNSEFNFREYANFHLSGTDQIELFYPAFTIGEATTATILTRNDDGDNFYCSFRNWGYRHDLCMIPLPNISQYTTPRTGNGQFPLVFYADSEDLIRFTMKKLITHYRKDHELNQRTYDIVYGHSASETSCTYWMKHARMSDKKLFRTHEKYGNTVSASIPLAISLSLEQDVLKRGMNALAVVGSAGIVTAYCRFEY
jgi:3-oxoacyl-[acyl-carrier-protein] synthase III